MVIWQETVAQQGATMITLKALPAGLIDLLKALAAPDVTPS